MKNLLGCIILILFTQFSCKESSKGLKGGDLSSNKIEISIQNYMAIENRGNCNIIYEQKIGEPPYLILETNAKIEKKPVVNVANGKLIIKATEKNIKCTIYTNSQTLEAIQNLGSGNIKISNNLVSEKILLDNRGSGNVQVHHMQNKNTQINIMGSGNVKIKEGLEASDFSTNLSGSGNIEIVNLNCINAQANIKGSGNIHITGKAVNNNITLRGSGNFEAFQFQTSSTICKIFGSGEARINATDNLNAETRGSGNIWYAGKPHKMNKTTKGSGKIRAK